VLFIDGGHEGCGGWQDLINKDENGLLGSEFDTFPDNINKLPDGKILLLMLRIGWVR
jgi:hypothetical protein